MLALVRIGTTTVSVNFATRMVFERWLQRGSMRRRYPLADGVIVPSFGAADDLAASIGLPREHIRVVPSPIVTRSRPPGSGAGRSPLVCGGGATGDPGVGEVGARKDFSGPVRAFARVRRVRRVQRYRPVILDRGRQRESLLDLAGRFGGGSDVDLPGFKPNRYAHMARASVFALSSR